MSVSRDSYSIHRSGGYIMRKNNLLRWLFPILISILLVSFSACDEEEGQPQDPTPTDQVSVDDSTAEEPGEEVHVHTWSDWYASVDPTCAREGEKTRECSCGERQTESIPTLQHTVVYSQAVAPTCTDAGRTEGSYCSACGVIIAPQEAIAPLGHTPVQLEAVAPTCMSSGSTAGTICSVCSAVLVKSETVAPLEHDKITRIIAPTCVLAGYTETECMICHVTETSDYTEPLGHTESIISGKQSGVTDGKSCTVCHVVYVEQTVIPALGHKETVVAGYDATCTQAGLTDGVCCLICEAVVTPQTVIPQKPHTYHEVKVEPTCLEQGYTEKTCISCADSFKEQYVKATGHTVVDVPAVGATCFASGMTGSAYCSDCGETLLSGEIIPPLDHTPVSVPAVAPTCQATGWTEGVICAACETVLSDRKVVQKIDHVYGITVVAPTCLEGGYTLFTCSGCQNTYRDHFLDATGHSYGNWYLEETSGRTVSTFKFNKFNRSTKL